MPRILMTFSEFLPGLVLGSKGLLHAVKNSSKSSRTGVMLTTPRPLRPLCSAIRFRNASRNAPPTLFRALMDTCPIRRTPPCAASRQSPARWKTRGARPTADPPAAKVARWRRARRAARVRAVLHRMQACNPTHIEGLLFMCPVRETRLGPMRRRFVLVLLAAVLGCAAGSPATSVDDFFYVGRCAAAPASPWQCEAPCAALSVPVGEKQQDSSKPKLNYTYTELNQLRGVGREMHDHAQG